jgi:hypothetical protein
MKIGTYKATGEGIKYIPLPALKAKIGGKKLIIKPDNTLYSTIRSFGNYEEVR